MSALNLYIFYVLTVIAALFLLFVNVGAAGLRGFIIRCTEYSVYLLLFAFVIVGGISLGTWGMFLGTEAAVAGMLVGSLAGFVLALPVVAFILLQIDIAKSLRELTSKETRP